MVFHCEQELSCCWARGWWRPKSNCGPSPRLQERASLMTSSLWPPAPGSVRTRLQVHFRNTMRRAQPESSLLQCMDFGKPSFRVSSLTSSPHTLALSHSWGGQRPHLAAPGSCTRCFLPAACAPGGLWCEWCGVRAHLLPAGFQGCGQAGGRHGRVQGGQSSRDWGRVHRYA